MSQAKICMLDIETLDTVPTAKILSLGAVDVYGEADWYAEFGHYQYGRTVSTETLEWWQQQRAMPNGSENLKAGLQRFYDWYKEQAFTEVWCKGTDFDFVILRDAFKGADVPIPWEYNQVRDLRTLMKLFPECKLAFRNRIQHHALADAAHQAYQLQEILKHVRGLINPSSLS